MVDPKLANPMSDTVEPSRLKLRRDNDEPRVEKSMIDKVDPRMPIPNIDRDEPMRANLLTDTELPSRACSSRLIAEARRATPATAMWSPNLQYPRTDMVDPR